MALLKFLANRVHLARNLSSSDWLSLFEAWWILLGFHLALRWVSYERLQNLAPTAKSEFVDPVGLFSVARKYHTLVAWASRLHVLPMTCLVRSLTLQRMLSRRRMPAKAYIGVKKTADGIQAHSWVEVAGEQIGEGQDVADRFAVLQSRAGY